MKTPDMAKENNFILREAAKAACDGYYTHLQYGGKGDPAEERWIEALTAGADAITKVAVLESRLAQVERERDAAVADLTDSSDCSFCMYKNNNMEFGCGSCIGCEKECPCALCSKGLNGFKWRGVCAENTKEEGK